MNIISKCVIVSIFCCYFSSCSQEDNPIPSISAEDLYCNVDATVISGAKLNTDLFERQNIGNLEEYRASTKTVHSYNDFYFLIFIEIENPEFHLYNKEEDKILQSELYTYLRSKTDVIRKDWDYHAENGETTGYGMEHFFTAFIDGTVEITSDKTLFGLAPGENLVNHFKILNNHSCQPVGIDIPYSIIHCNDLENSLQNSVFCDKAWLRYSYSFMFNDIPDEMYDEITFKLKLPLIKENSSHYISYLIKGYESKVRYENVVYQSEIKIIFKH